MNGGQQKKNRLDDHSPQILHIKKRRGRSGTKGINKNKNSEDQDAVMSTFSDKQHKSKTAEPRKKESQLNSNLYMLVGVLVHSGSANSGHYYSYIKERKYFVAQERWLEFNDTNVTEFDKSKLAQECFGTQKMQQMQSPNQIMMERNCNAYCLFYERVQKMGSVECSLPLVDNQSELAHDSSDEDNSQHKLVNNVQLPLYKAIWDENQAFIKLKLFFDAEYLHFAREFLMIYKSSGFTIAADAQESSLYFAKQYSISDQLQQLIDLQSKAEHLDPLSLTRDLKDINNAAPSSIVDVNPKSLSLKEALRQELSLYSIKFATAMSYDIALKFKDANGFVQWIQLLDSLYERNAIACVWLVKQMTESKDVLNQLLLEHPNAEVREAFSNLLKTVIGVTAKNEEAYFSERIEIQRVVVEIAGEKVVQGYISNASVIRFMEYFFGELFDTKVRENWRRYDEYFSVLKDFCQQSFLAAKFMLDRQAIYRLIEFVMNRKSPFDADKKAKMGEGQLVEPGLTRPLDLISFLIRCTFTSGIAAQNVFAPTSVYQDEQRKIMIPVQEVEFLIKDETLTEILRRCSDSHSDDAINALASIVAHLSWGDKNVSQFFVRHLLSYLDRLSLSVQSLTQYDATLRTLYMLLSLKDGENQLDRISLIFDLNSDFIDSKPLIKLAMSKANTNPLFTLNLLKFIVETAQSEPKLRNYLRLFSSAYMEQVIEFLRVNREASPDKTELKPQYTDMLAQVSQKIRELLNLEFDFAFDFEGGQANAFSQPVDSDMMDNAIKEERAFGLNTSFNREAGFEKTFQDVGENGKMFFNVANMEFKDDYFGKKAKNNDSMDVEMDDYQGDRIFDDDF